MQVMSGVQSMSFRLTLTHIIFTTFNIPTSLRNIHLLLGFVTPNLLLGFVTPNLLLGFVTPNLDAFNSLLSKHPPLPHDRRPTPIVKTGSYSCTVLELIKAIKKFAPGSAAGWGGLRPQHLQDMLQNAGPGCFPSTLCELVNMVLAGMNIIFGIPQSVRHAFFSASLHALKKKDGGLRSIALGLTLHPTSIDNLTSKLASKLGLVLNHAKYENIGRTVESRSD